MHRMGFLSLLLFTCFLLESCSVKTNSNARIDLPTGTSLDKAKEIVTSIWDDNFVGKIKEKYPDFDPVGNPSKQGLYLRWGYRNSPDGPQDIHLLLTVTLSGSSDQIDGIVEYAKSLVEQYIQENLK